MSRVAPFVSVKWLSGQLKAPNVRIIDASWHLPSANRDPHKEYLEKHIPEAQFFGVDECCDKKSKYEHMVPSPKEFEEYVGKLGIDNNTHVVIYDNNEKFGMLSSPRVWWTFRLFGHNMISILDGGLPKWIQEGQATTDKISKVDVKKFKASPIDPSKIKTFEDVEKNITSKAFKLMDARPPGRFNGTEPEPRADIKPGHIPGAVNVPASSVMNPDTKLLKDKKDLEKMFADKGIQLDKPLVASCGSGLSACCLLFAAHLCGKDNIPLYDGAWTEWFIRSKPEQREDCPK